jgi:hypothetical protein
LSPIVTPLPLITDSRRYSQSSEAIRKRRIAGRPTRSPRSSAWTWVGTGLVGAEPLAAVEADQTDGEKTAGSDRRLRAFDRGPHEQGVNCAA